MPAVRDCDPAGVVHEPVVALVPALPAQATDDWAMTRGPFHSASLRGQPPKPRKTKSRRSNSTNVVASRWPMTLRTLVRRTVVTLSIMR